MRTGGARRGCVLLFALWIHALPIPAGQRKFELRGRIEPARAAGITLFGSYTPFAASTQADGGGRFRFKNLEPGNYTLSIAVRGQGEVRRSIEVSPTLADSKGRIEVTVRFQPAAGTAEETVTVSAREFSIPQAASKEYARALKSLEQRDTTGAIGHLRRAVEIAPQFAVAWNHLGTIAYQSQQFAEAEKDFRTALAQEPDAYSPLVNLGGVLLNLNRPREALEYNLRAVAARPEDALANSQLGMTYGLLGDDDAAIRYLDAAKRIDPGHFSNPQLVLAGIYSRRGERAKAAAELEDFLARHPDTPEAAKLRSQIDRLRRP